MRMDQEDVWQVSICAKLALSDYYDYARSRSTATKVATSQQRGSFPLLR